ncbi:putative cytochrome P450, partial [Tanacetum coccineum]
ALELLAKVAILEKEVARLEEEIMVALSRGTVAAKPPIGATKKRGTTTGVSSQKAGAGRSTKVLKPVTQAASPGRSNTLKLSAQRAGLETTVCVVTYVDSSESTCLCIEDNTFIAMPRKLVSSSEIERVLDAQIAYLPSVQVLVKAFLLKCNYWLSKDWLTRATNWAKFGAITGLGVILRGHLEQQRSLMSPPYFLQTGLKEVQMETECGLGERVYFSLGDEEIQLIKESEGCLPRTSRKLTRSMLNVSTKINFPSVLAPACSTYQDYCMSNAPVRRAMLVEVLRRRGRHKLRWEDRLKQDMMELLLSLDMTSNRNAWRDKIRISR